MTKSKNIVLAVAVLVTSLSAAHQMLSNQATRQTVSVAATSYEAEQAARLKVYTGSVDMSQVFKPR